MRALTLIFILYSAPMPDTAARSGDVITIIIPAAVAANTAVCAIG